MPVKGARGFTLLEVLLAMVLISGVAVVFILNVDAILEPDPILELERSFKLAQSEGRMMAVKDRRTLRLLWDKEAKRFVLLDQAVVSSYPIKGLRGKALKLDATFYLQEVMTKGDSFERFSWYEVDSISIYPDATSPLFKVTLVDGSGKIELEIEPFTGFVSKRSRSG